MELLLHFLPVARHCEPDSMIEYAIYKMYKPPSYWDGPFKTLAAARKAFATTYSNDPEEPQDFAIFKVTTTKVNHKWVKRKSKPRRAFR